MAGDTYKDKFNASVINIAADPKKYHPVATNHFTVTFKLPEGLINQADPKKRTIRESGLDPILALKIANQDIQEPTLSQQKLTYKKGNLSISFPGTIDEFNGSANFDVFVKQSAYDILYSWKLASGDHLTGEVGDPEDYWAEVDIDVTTGNKGTLVGTWRLHNVWCSQLQGITFNNNSNETKKVTIQLSFFKPEWISGAYDD